MRNHFITVFYTFNMTNTATLREISMVYLELSWFTILIRISITKMMTIVTLMTTTTSIKETKAITAPQNTSPVNVGTDDVLPGRNNTSTEVEPPASPEDTSTTAINQWTLDQHDNDILPSTADPLQAHDSTVSETNNEHQDDSVEMKPLILSTLQQRICSVEVKPWMLPPLPTTPLTREALISTPMLTNILILGK